ncbi:hypothetical protein [Pseudofrankia inefficax]|uniref:Uncharacterized protein n=1 Tax=Pseudofrankia inefficax (strain DSM 45817 / CECT 9037 / DDB 130130 / EuI1c) TaxID=298654 RepID=E3JD42_PSEI1|nr:hypothetical protein [Pseudofrankia inefficax]ADP82326.1 hypothetical protein FraEuI1c_4327 [Pseudofrankia inefficax]
MGTLLFRSSPRLAPARPAGAARRDGRRALRPAVAAVAALGLVLCCTLTACARAGGAAEAGPARTGSRPSDATPAPPSWRTESFLDAVVDVPASWGFDAAPTSDWCVPLGQSPAGPRQPYVDTRGPGSVVMMIGCPGGTHGPDLNGSGVPPEYWTTHLWFAATPAPAGSARVPDGRVSADGWTRIVRTVGSAKVLVLSDGAHLGDAERVIASARRATVDPHGCAASSPIQAGGFVRPAHPFDVAGLRAVGGAAVCLYDLSRPVGTPGLVAFRAIGGPDATALLAAIQAAPVGGGPDAPQDCVKGESGDTAIVLRLVAAGVAREAYVYYDWCFGNGIDDGTALRALTTDDCGPLWAERVTLWSGPGGPFQVCHRPTTHS